VSNVSINGQPVAPKRPVQLVSRTAILILSGVLVGTAVGHGVPAGIYVHCFCAGVLGLVAFVTLDHLAERRRKQTVRRALERSQRTLASRIDRHVALAPVKRSRRHRASAESSYLTVTMA
jgi:hypothetical protein